MCGWASVQLLGDFQCCECWLMADTASSPLEKASCSWSYVLPRGSGSAAHPGSILGDTACQRPHHPRSHTRARVSAGQGPEAPGAACRALRVPLPRSATEEQPRGGSIGAGLVPRHRSCWMACHQLGSERGGLLQAAWQRPPANRVFSFSVLSWGSHRFPQVRASVGNVWFS